MKLILLIAGGFLAIVLVLGLIFSNGGGGSKYLTQRFMFRIERLQSMAREGTKSSNNEVRKIASEMTIILSGHTSTLQPLMPIGKADKDLAKVRIEEQDDAGQKTLKDAQLNGIFDTTYKRLLEQKLQETYALATEVKTKYSNAKLKTAIESLQEDLNTYYKQLQATR